MEKLCVLFAVGSFINRVLAQGEVVFDDKDDLEDKYGLPIWFPGLNQFPNQNQFSNQNQLPNQNQFPAQTGSDNGVTTMAPQILQCIRQCPVTPEYNPVCGSDNVNYTNPGRLTCAQMCGVDVSQLRSSPCPPPQLAATQQ